MELAALRTFISVVEKGGISRAAEELNRVPSSVTTRIFSLEDSLGVQLFLREGKRLYLTSEGRTLYSYARRIMELAYEAENQVRSKDPRGRFRIGAMESTAATRLPQPLADLHAKYPRLELELATGPSSMLMFKELLANKFDAVFVTDAPSDVRVESMPAFEEELVLIAAKGHRAVSEPEDIACKTILAFKEGCFYRKRLVAWFRVFNLEPDRIMDLSSYNVIFGAVAAGMGIAIVPTGIVELFPNKNAVSIHRLGSPFGRALTELVWRKGQYSANIAALQECLAGQPDFQGDGANCREKGVLPGGQR
ncbi:MAG: LysR family transcriptional regulator [Desulfovibrio sp.]|jgi:DNA-binding transcriptional LysR family regulator|nr:LysR family transcriptional regulator [Desulfovibrio sp.]